MDGLGLRLKRGSGKGLFDGEKRGPVHGCEGKRIEGIKKKESHRNLTILLLLLLLCLHNLTNRMKKETKEEQARPRTLHGLVTAAYSYLCSQHPLQLQVMRDGSQGSKKGH
jgi:hypothetical protein